MQIIKVKVILRGGLAASAFPGVSEFDLRIPAGVTVEYVATAAAIPIYEVMGAASGQTLKRLSDPVDDGEILEFLPVISSG